MYNSELSQGLITSEDGHSISWISSDIGIINHQVNCFMELNQFDITNS